jgi:hypothetical protein
MSEYQTLYWAQVPEWDAKGHDMGAPTITGFRPKAPTKKPQAFPRAAVEASLRTELVEAVKAEAAIRGIGVPSTSKALANAPFQIDSLVVVSILCAVEPIVGFELPDEVVRAGGYASLNSALEQLLPRIEALWIKQQGGKP